MISSNTNEFNSSITTPSIINRINEDYPQVETYVTGPLKSIQESVVPGLSTELERVQVLQQDSVNKNTTEEAAGGSTADRDLDVEIASLGDATEIAASESLQLVSSGKGVKYWILQMYIWVLCFFETIFSNIFLMIILIFVCIHLFLRFLLRLFRRR